MAGGWLSVARVLYLYEYIYVYVCVPPLVAMPGPR